jgi:hypothetical protein
MMKRESVPKGKQEPNGSKCAVDRATSDSTKHITLCMTIYTVDSQLDINKNVLMNLLLALTISYDKW